MHCMYSWLLGSARELTIYNLDFPYDREEKMQSAELSSQKRGQHLFALKWTVWNMRMCVCVCVLYRYCALCVLSRVCVDLHGSLVMRWLLNLTTRYSASGGPLYLAVVTHSVCFLSTLSAAADPSMIYSSGKRSRVYAIVNQHDLSIIEFTM